MTYLGEAGKRGMYSKYLEDELSDNYYHTAIFIGTVYMIGEKILGSLPEEM